MSYVITERCTGCGICEIKCPTDAITGVKKEMFYIDPQLCIDCNTCGTWCPDTAILNAQGAFCDYVKAKDIPKAVVVDELCSGCEYCIDVCPFDCISLAPGKDPANYYQVAKVNERTCVGCRLCEEACIKEAIVMRGATSTALSQHPLRGSSYLENPLYRPAEANPS